MLDKLLSGHVEAVKYGNFIEGDFGDNTLLKNIFDSQPVDAGVHFAVLVDVTDSVRNSGGYYENNVAKMIILLDMMVE